MSVIPSQVPQRLPAGMTTDPPYGPWADIGNGNPFFYHQFADDFDNSLGPTGEWTITLDGGTAVHTAGDGGLVTLTTSGSISTFVSMQLPAADFTLPQGALAGKKMGFLFRLTGLSNLNLSSFVIGMCDTTATVFTAITDGIYFHKGSGSTQISLLVASGGTTVTFNLPTADYPAANNTQIDMAWVIDRYGNILVSIGSQLVGWIPQSGTGGSIAAPGFYPSLPVLCPTSKFYSGNQPTTVASGYTLTTAVLNPTIGIQAGGASAMSLTADFIGVSKER
jgi:hypothetical protein